MLMTLVNSERTDPIQESRCKRNFMTSEPLVAFPDGRLRVPPLTSATIARLHLPAGRTYTSGR